jgi:hypothetical protein
MKSQPEEPRQPVSKIIEMHLAAKEASRQRLADLEQSKLASFSVQAAAAREQLQAVALPLLDEAAAALKASGFKAHVTHAEDTRGGDTFDAWIVSTIIVEVPRDGERLLVQLQFLGTATPANWFIDSHVCGPANALGDRQLHFPSSQFVGTPEDLVTFTRTQIEKFISAIFPS